MCLIRLNYAVEARYGVLLDVATKVALRDAVQEAAEDPAVRCVVLTGSGRAFSSGLDLKDHGIVPNIDGLQVGRIAQRAMRHYSRLVPLLRSWR